MSNSHAWLVDTLAEIADLVEKKGMVVIGWTGMGDLSQFKTGSEMQEKYRRVYNTDSSAKVAEKALQSYQPD